MVPWGEVGAFDFGGAEGSLVQTLICAICLTSNLNAAFPLKLVTYSRSVGSARSKVLIDIPPGLDGYQYFVEGTWPGNSVRDIRRNVEWNPQGQTMVNGHLVCAFHASEILKPQAG